MISDMDNPGGAKQDPAPDTVQKDSMPVLDTSNQFCVRPTVGGLIVDFPAVIGCTPVTLPFPLTKHQAINLAAWLMVLADPTGEQFERVVKQIVKS